MHYISQSCIWGTGLDWNIRGNALSSDISKEQRSSLNLILLEMVKFVETCWEAELGSQYKSSTFNKYQLKPLEVAEVTVVVDCSD